MIMKPLLTYSNKNYTQNSTTLLTSPEKPTRKKRRMGAWVQKKCKNNQKVKRSQINPCYDVLQANVWDGDEGHLFS